MFKPISLISNKQKQNLSYQAMQKTQYPIVFAHGLLGFNRLATENLAMDY